jgi:hypothetical protein
MANIVSIKSFRLNDIRYPVTGNATSFTESRAILTPIIDDASGEVVGHTQEFQGGMVKCEVALTNAADYKALRNVSEGTIVIELVNNMTITGQNVTQIAASEVSLSEGKVALEYSGNVRVK